MSAGGPEWITARIFDATQYTDDGPRRVRLRVGLVRMPHGDDVRIASQADDRDIFVLPPHVTAQIIGVLRSGLTQM